MNISVLSLLYMNDKIKSLTRIEERNYYSKHYDKIGVNHDPQMYLSFTNKSKRTKSKIAELLKKDYLTEKGLTTFCFVASGYEDLERLSVIQYDQIICIDPLISKYECVIYSHTKRIIKLSLDLISAISVMRECHVKIDCWCDNNSGQICGFGEGYSTQSAIVMTSAMDLFKDKFVVVGSYQYQKKVANYQIAKNYLKLPNSKVWKLSSDELKQFNLDFNPNLITLYPHSSAPLDYNLIVKQTETIEKTIKYNGIIIHLIKGNIFDYTASIDLKMLVFRSIYQYNQYRNNYTNLLEARGRYIYEGEVFDLNDAKDLTKLITIFECKSIAFIPQNNPNKDWLALLEELVQNTNLTDIYFFHIHNDFSELYLLFEHNRD
jgi:hypothetical protein